MSGLIDRTMYSSNSNTRPVILYLWVWFSWYLELDFFNKRHKLLLRQKYHFIFSSKHIRVITSSGAVVRVRCLLIWFPRKVFLFRNYKSTHWLNIKQSNARTTRSLFASRLFAQCYTNYFCYWLVGLFHLKPKSSLFYSIP